MSTGREHVPQRGRLAGMIFSAVWLLYLAQPLNDAWSRQQPTWAKVLATVLIAVFAVTYLVSLAWSFGRVPYRLGRRWSPWLLLALGLAILPLTGPSGVATFVFVSVTAQALWPVREAVAAAVVLTGSAVAIGVLVPGWGAATDIAFSVGAASLAMFGVMRLVDRNRALSTAQDELARLAIVEERERFGRDVHDVIGHSLTVITLKAELARKLVDRDPDRAKQELAEVERLSREALSDMRATVAGYREVTLVGELSSARTALAAAGIEADIPGAVDEVTGTARELFGWVVREGVTNVVRHSSARRCSVRLSTSCVEIVDDGRGWDPVAAPGHGLAGLRERVARCGGQLEAGPMPGGGFRLAVLVPT